MKSWKLILSLVFVLLLSSLAQAQRFVYFVVPYPEQNAFEVYGRFMSPYGIPPYTEGQVDPGDMVLGLAGWSLDFETSPGLAIQYMQIATPRYDPYGFTTEYYGPIPGPPVGWRVGSMQQTISPPSVLEWVCFPWGWMKLAEGIYSGEGMMIVSPDEWQDGPGDTRVTITFLYGDSSAGYNSQFTNPGKVEAYKTEDVSPPISIYLD